MRYAVLSILLLTISVRADAQAVFDCIAPVAPDLPDPVILGDGTSGSVSGAMIQAALDAGGAILVDAGSGVIDVGSTLEVTRESSLDLGGATLSGGGARRVIEVSNPGNQTYTFDLRHGAIRDGATPGGSGAGLYKATGGPWQAVTIHIFDIEFHANHAIALAQDGGGGAIYVVGAAELAIVDSSLHDNSGSNGGAVYSLGSARVDIYDSTFAANTATGSGGNPGNGGNGGALGVDGDARDVNLCRVRMTGNSANAFGGAFFTVTYSADSFTRIEDSTLQSNASVATDKLAGGAYIQGSPVEITGTTFRDNSASGYAGLALFGYGGVLEGRVADSTFVGNTARNGLGGAMAIQAATSLVLENLTIARNTAPCDVCFAAGIANDDGTHLTLRNVLFEDNVGGNIYNPWAMLHPAAAGAANLQWPESRGSGQNEMPAAPGTSFAAANLTDPAPNGGPTETMAIASSSPARDAGTSVGASPVDQRGFARVGAVDIGAFEWQGDAIFANGFD